MLQYKNRHALSKIEYDVDRVFNKIWDYGENIVLGWSANGHTLRVLAAPYWQVAELAAAHPAVIRNGHRFSHSKMVKTVERLNLRPHEIELTVPLDGEEGLRDDAINRIIRRYSLNYVPHRAVILFDIVGFSKFNSLQQVAQLNSLAHSINFASRKLIELGFHVEINRSTTGDGFYVWNCVEGLEADTALFHLMTLILANNKIARKSSHMEEMVPILRTCIAIDSHYEYYHATDFTPETNSYIVGDVTIKLARMCDRTLPGQILVGDFLRPDQDSNGHMHPVDFITRARTQSDAFKDLLISDHRVVGMRSYLTGRRINDNEFTVRRYKIRDKHGFLHHLFNAKVNIETDRGPIYLGLQNGDLNGFEATVVDINPNFAFGVPVL